MLAHRLGMVPLVSQKVMDGLRYTRVCRFDFCLSFSVSSTYSSSPLSLGLLLPLIDAPVNRSPCPTGTALACSSLAPSPSYRSAGFPPLARSFANVQDCECDEGCYYCMVQLRLQVSNKHGQKGSPLAVTSDMLEVIPSPNDVRPSLSVLFYQKLTT